MNEEMIIIAFITFIKLILISNLITEFIALTLSTISNINSKNNNETKKFTKFININCVFIIINYLIFHNLEMVIDLCEVIQEFSNLIGYLLFIFTISVLGYVIQIAMGTLSYLIIKDSWKTVEEILNKKDE